MNFPGTNHPSMKWNGDDYTFTKSAEFRTFSCGCSKTFFKKKYRIYTKDMDIYSFVTTIILGSLVLLSYYIVLVKWEPGPNYFTHKFWLGIDPTIVKILTCLQVLAAIGFVIALGTWIFDKPTSGIMGKHQYILPLTLAVLLITAIIWPFATYFDISWLVVSSLVMTAICSILLLAGSIEENTPKWWVILGWLLLSTVTVLGDAVVWNAKYIVNKSMKNST